jgi:hypothetical protein
MAINCASGMLSSHGPSDEEMQLERQLNTV